jgi:predicted Zn-dependent peptidase
METIYKKTVLSNGIRVVTEYMPHVRSVSIGAWIEAGSRDETPETNGISHFLEHMVFKGTVSRSSAAIAESLESVGGSLNAFTGKEVTCFYANILDENIELAVDVLSDLIGNAVIDAENLIKEKLVVIEEINSLEDTPDELIHDYFHKDIFTDKPLSYPILGTKDIVTSFEQTQLIEFRNQQYNSNNLVIAAAGNLDHHKLVTYAQEYFHIPSSKKNVHQNSNYTPKTVNQTYIKNVSQAHICTGSISVPYDDSRKYALLLLHSLLGGGMSSRLFQNIREKYGVAYSIYSFADFFSDTGLFGVYLGVDTSNISRALKLVQQEFDRAKCELITIDELNRLKCHLKGNLMLGLESTHSRMNRLAKMEINLNDYISLDQVLNGIDAVKTEDVFSIAKQVLKDNMTTTIITSK